MDVALKMPKLSILFIHGDIMKTNEDFVADLISNAEQAKHQQFRFITCWEAYKYYRKLRWSHILLVKGLKESTNKIFKKHCKAVRAGNSDILTMIAYCTVKNVLSFYEEELNTITDMLDEYECYLLRGNWLDFVFDLPRPFEKLWDHRR